MMLHALTSPLLNYSTSVEYRKLYLAYLPCTYGQPFISTHASSNNRRKKIFLKTCYVDADVYDVVRPTKLVSVPNMYRPVLSYYYSLKNLV